MFVRIVWRGLPKANNQTLAYYKNPKFTAVKSFITLATGGDPSDGQSRFRRPVPRNDFVPESVEATATFYPHRRVVDQRQRDGGDARWRYSYSNFRGLYYSDFFTVVIYRFSYKARVFVIDKPFQPSLMLVGNISDWLTKRIILTIWNIVFSFTGV